jgi:glycine betaine/choline ABC-type transport system substrate-binding protein
LEQEIFSKSQSQLSIPSTASKPVKLSTIQRESQQSQLFYQSINQSQSSESQVEVLDDDEDFDNFFSSSPVVEKRKKNIEHTKSPSWTQVITPMKTKPKTQVCAINSQ